MKTTNNLNAKYSIKLIKSASKKFHNSTETQKNIILDNISSELKYLVMKEFDNNSALAKEVLFYLKKYNIDFKYFVERLSNYTTFHSKAGSTNKMYDEILIRIIMHFHFYLEGSYHRVRGITPQYWIKKYKPATIIDVGYSSPSDYALDQEILSNCKITLSDYNANAHKFSKVIFKYHNINSKFINFKIQDMNKLKYLGNYDMYMFMDSIEHVKNPTKYLQVQVSNAPKNSLFVFSIPISPITSFKNIHFAQWLNEKSAEKWIKENGLHIIEKELAIPNIFIDKFATLTKDGYYNAIYLCKK